jgi:hypothetical protein
MTVNLNIQSNTGTYQGGTFQLGPLTISSAFASLQVVSITFGSGTFINTASPAGAYACIIEPPANNLIQLTLKGVMGDTGIPIAANLPTIIPFFNPAVANNVGLTSANAINGVVTLTFF